MIWLTWAFDLTLAAALLWLAAAALLADDPFRSVVLFVALGLVMALVWVRLAAPEVALAEAAIGAGITGTLLLSALPRLPAASPAPLATPARPGRREWATPRLVTDRGVPHERLPRLARVGPLLLVGGLWLLTTILWFQASPPAPGLAPTVTAALPTAGVSNRVTAVLLNFRAYDTLLEMAVLLLAVLGVRSLGAGPPLPAPPPANAILLTLARGVLPLAVLVAGYLVWIGDRVPGGAFQGGAILGAAGVLLALIGRPLTAWLPPLLLRLGLVAGLLVFLALAVLPLAAGRFFLQYPPAAAGLWILLIEAVAALAIGLALTSLALPDAAGQEP